ncbi:hypothetical protein GTQ43_18625 [Nostoc sp. KVJ3]|uniref:hypothetical protein n=1 Tax=Nostoc sp. KVJ3 TaxID=457945 RepID=UPI0022385EAA|nr:hypothetical protein [Nostoc sp. KVJ3]MCW5315753.1 hypothetical protein [Nostoc sp. KVJ3]
MQIGDAIAYPVLEFRYIIKPSGETIRLLWLLTLIDAQIFNCDEFYNSLLLMSFVHISRCFEEIQATSMASLANGTPNANEHHNPL